MTIQKDTWHFIKRITDKRKILLGMYSHIDFWCTACLNCASRKTPKGRKSAPMLPIPVEGPFDRVAVDVIGPLPPSLKGNRYIIVF